MYKVVSADGLTTDQLRVVEHTLALAKAVSLIAETIECREPEAAAAIGQIGSDIQADSERLIDFATRVRSRVH